MSEKWERWGKEETRTLKKHYPNTPRDELTQLLPGRGWRSICRAAERHGLHRKHYGAQRTKQFLEELHDKLSIARQDRKPFAGCRHSLEARISISVSNLYTRGHSIADIAERKDITEKEVEKIIEKKNERTNR